MSHNQNNENFLHLDEGMPEEIDISQLLRNLSLTPDQRLKEHQSALNLVIELEKAGNKLREQSK